MHARRLGQAGGVAAGVNGVLGKRTPRASLLFGGARGPALASLCTKEEGAATAGARRRKCVRGGGAYLQPCGARQHEQQQVQSVCTPHCGAQQRRAAPGRRCRTRGASTDQSRSSVSVQPASASQSATRAACFPPSSIGSALPHRRVCLHHLTRSGFNTCTLQAWSCGEVLPRAWWHRWAEPCCCFRAQASRGHYNIYLVL